MIPIRFDRLNPTNARPSESGGIVTSGKPITRKPQRYRDPDTGLTFETFADLVKFLRLTEGRRRQKDGRRPIIDNDAGTVWLLRDSGWSWKDIAAAMHITKQKAVALFTIEDSRE